VETYLHDQNSYTQLKVVFGFYKLKVENGKLCFCLDLVLTWDGAGMQFPTDKTEEAMK
jgi:hypothetical protein